jgi:hypothetical protein
MDLVAAIHREGRRLARFGEAFGGKGGEDAKNSEGRIPAGCAAEAA